MRVVLKIAALMLGLIGVSTGLAGEIEPFQTGTVFGGPQASDTSRQLAEPKLHELYSWLSTRQPNLHMIFSSPPFPSCSVLLIDTNGRRIKLDLYSVNESWKHAVQIRMWEGSKFIYGGEMNLPSADMTALREILSPYP